MHRTGPQETGFGVCSVTFGTEGPMGTVAGPRSGRVTPGPPCAPRGLGDTGLWAAGRWPSSDTDGATALHLSPPMAVPAVTVGSLSCPCRGTTGLGAPGRCSGAGLPDSCVQPRGALGVGRSSPAPGSGPGSRPLLLLSPVLSFSRINT